MSSSKIWKSSPWAYSVTTQNSFFVSKKSSIRIMFGWFNSLKISISNRKLRSSFLDFPFLLMNFRATICPVYFLLPLYTFPNDPSPIFSITT